MTSVSSFRTVSVHGPQTLPAITDPQSEIGSVNVVAVSSRKVNKTASISGSVNPSPLHIASGST